MEDNQMGWRVCAVALGAWCITTTVCAEELRVEAEASVLDAMEVVTDLQASGGLAISTLSRRPAAATSSFEVGSPGDYYLWYRYRNNAQRAAKMTISLDGRRTTTRLTHSTKWSWKRLGGKVGKALHFNEGRRQVTFSISHKDLDIDAFIFTTQATFSPMSEPVSETEKTPSMILNLSNWKLTLPTGHLGRPLEILQPGLATFSSDPYFRVSHDGRAVQFRAPTEGVTTRNSKYIRSELREMTDGGTKNASWSTTSGTHRMFIDQAITAVPFTKKHVVAGQIHGGSDDVVVIRLEYPKLFVDINGTRGPILDQSYELGRRFTVEFRAAHGRIDVYYNGSTRPAASLLREGSGMYFKAGAYTQSNCDKETEAPCGSDNYGEVVIYDLKVSHD
jgi:hypothetical protein